VDAHQIPTGERKEVKGTLFDFTATHPAATESGVPLREAVLAVDGGCEGVTGIDHTFVVDASGDSSGNGTDDDAATDKNSSSSSSSSLHLQCAAVLTDEASGRRMTVRTTQPGVQIYTANFLPPSATPTGAAASIHCQHNAVCLETQHFPDAINQPQFPSIVLEAGSTYNHRTIFEFTTIPK
jgi:aldose 1-epimerase